MALSGRIEGSYRGWTVRTNWTATQSIDGNYSTVTAKMYLILAKTYSLYINARSHKVVIDGTTYTINSKAISSGAGTIYLGSASKRVYHKNDGTKSFKISATFDMRATLNDVYISTVTGGSGTFTLDTIPRTSPLYIRNTDGTNISSATFGNTIQLYAPRASNNFTTTFRYAFHGTSGTVASKVASNTQNWTPPNSLMNRITKATSGTLYIYADTYNGSSKIGTSTKTIRMNVPSSIGPTISSATVTEAVAGIASKFGAYIQGYSKAKATMSASSQYGATITGYKITMIGVTYGSSSATSPAIAKAGTHTITFEATDSRGRSVKTTRSITVLAYKPPTVTKFDVYRAVGGLNGIEAANESTDAFFNISGVCSEYADTANPYGKNNVNIVLYYKRTGTSTWLKGLSSQASRGNNKIEYGGWFLKDGVYEMVFFSTEYSYDIKVVVSDYFNTVEFYRIVPSSFVLIDYYKGGKGMAFGQVAQRDGLDVNLDTNFKKNLNKTLSNAGQKDEPIMRTYRSDGSLQNAFLTGFDGDGLFMHFYKGGSRTGLFGLNGDGTIYNEEPYLAALQNGWSNYSDAAGTYNRANYWKGKDNVVRLSGLVKKSSATTSDTIFTLPAGYRPAKQLIFVVFGNNSGDKPLRVDVSPNGAVMNRLATGTIGHLSLEGISFLAT